MGGAGRGRERCTRPSPGRPAAGTALSRRPSPALPRPGGFLPLHPPLGRLRRRAWPIPGLLRAIPPPCTLGFRSPPLASPGSLDLVAWPPPAPLVSSVLCVCPTHRAEQPGGAVCLSRLSMSHVVPGCPWLAARTPPSPPRGRWTVPPSIRSLPTPEGPGPSPPTPGALAGWGWGAWVPLVLPESGA